MPPAAANLYMHNKYQYESYQMDMLWASANEKTFKDYPRYVDYLMSNRPRSSRQLREYSEQDIIDMFKKAGRKGGR